MGASRNVVSLSSFIFGAYILLSASTVNCNKDHLRGLQSIKWAPASTPTMKQAVAEYEDWIENVRMKHELKQKLADKPGMIQPDLTLDFPGMKQYTDWESVVTPSTYIVVDQNGIGDFISLSDAINSIPKNRYRQYRITIQLNAGVYRFEYLRIPWNTHKTPYIRLSTAPSFLIDALIAGQYCFVLNFVSAIGATNPLCILQRKSDY